MLDLYPVSPDYGIESPQESLPADSGVDASQLHALAPELTAAEANDDDLATATEVATVAPSLNELAGGRGELVTTTAGALAVCHSDRGDSAIATAPSEMHHLSDDTRNHQQEGEGDPSATMPTPPELLKNAMSAVVPLFELDESQAAEAVTAYVAQRIETLSPTDTKISIGLADGGTDTFISPATPMIMSAITSKPYHLDDPKAYEVAFSDIRGQYEDLSGRLAPDVAYVNAVTNGINLGQARYFGSVVGSPNSRFAVTDDIVGSEGDPNRTVSIADFQDSAMCQERAGIAHNALLIFGVTSRFEAGSLEVRDEDGTTRTEPHAFITLLSASGTPYLYDPANPIIIHNDDGGLAGISPAIYKLDLDESGRQKVELREFTLNDGEPQVSLRRTLIYSLGEPRKF